MKPRSFFTILALICCASGLKAQKIQTRIDRSYDFSSCRSYIWEEKMVLTHLEKEEQQRIEEALVNAIELELKSKGMKQDAASPCIHLSVYGGPKSLAVAGDPYSPIDLANGGQKTMWTNKPIPGSASNAFVSVEALVLIEFTDPSSRQVVWSCLLKKKIKNPGKFPSDLDAAVANIARKAFVDFPPAAKVK